MKRRLPWMLLLAITLTTWTALLLQPISDLQKVWPTPQPPAHWQCQHKETLTTSWYGPGFDGRVTASGEIFDEDALTAAHRTLPFGTELCLYNPATGKYVHVRISDRGPYSEFDGVFYYEGRRDLDVSKATAEELGFKEQGLARLTVGIVDSTRD